MTPSVPQAVAHRATKWALYPARLLHHSVPAALSGSGTSESINPPSVGDSAPTPNHQSLSSPVEPKAHDARHNPVISGGHVTDFGRVDYVADPFLLPGDDRWHVFFEAYNRSREPTAVIAHATSRDGRLWRYDGVVLRETIHLSFPYVFKWDGKYYMLPDQQRASDAARVTLYRATSFPSGWEPVVDIVRPNRRTSDNVVFHWNDRWWCLVGHEPSGSLYCYHSETLEADGWEPHPENPVVSDRPEASRPAGRPLLMPEGILIFHQDCADRYGECVHATVVERLTPRIFTERSFQDRPVLAGSGAIGWNSGRMHHIDLWALNDRIICAVDGDISLGRGTWAGAQWSIGVYSWARSDTAATQTW